VSPEAAGTDTVLVPDDAWVRELEFEIEVAGSAPLDEVVLDASLVPWLHPAMTATRVATAITAPKTMAVVERRRGRFIGLLCLLGSAMARFLSALL
jgi:hypothetical protein